MTAKVNGDARPGGRDEYPDQPKLFDRILTTAERKALYRGIRQRRIALRKGVVDSNKTLFAVQRQVAAHLKEVRRNNQQVIAQACEAIATLAPQLRIDAAGNGLTIEGRRALLAKLPMVDRLLISAVSSTAVPLRELIYCAWQLAGDDEDRLTAVALARNYRLGWVYRRRLELRDGGGQ